MILIVTSKEDLTADFFILRLIEKRIPYFRLNTEDIPLRLEGAAEFPACNFIIRDELGKSICSEKVLGIWYRRPKLLSESDEINSQIFPYIREDSWFFVNGLLELTNDSINWVSLPDKIRRAENKIYQLKVACKTGLKIPKTFIGNSPEELRKLLTKLQTEKKELIAKPIRSGRYFLKNETRIFHTNLFPINDWKPEEIKIWPIIVQENIIKKREIRVTIFRDKIFSVGISTDGLSDKVQLDWRREIDQVKYHVINLPLELVNKLLSILDIMGLSFGAFDLIETTEGEYIFLEINPNGQWAWIEQKTGLLMRDALIQSLTKAA